VSADPFHDSFYDDRILRYRKRRRGRKRREDRKEISFPISDNNALGMAVNDLCDRSHYISAHVDRKVKKRERERERGREGEENGAERRRKTMEVSGGG